jgi:hypothetical protein
MGEGWQGITASSGGSENNWFDSCEACHISGRQEEDRCGDEGEMGKVPGAEGEEGGVDLRSLLLGMRQAFPSSASRISPEELHLATLSLVPPAHRDATNNFLETTPSSCGIMRPASPKSRSRQLRRNTP